MALFPSAPGGGQEAAFGYKGKGVLLHVITDSNGLPLAINSTRADGDERVAASNLLLERRVKKSQRNLLLSKLAKG
jgi:hypothetical protein